MNAEVKKVWVEALKSGAYAQCRNQLRRTDSDGRKSYCCLGVLCDILDPYSWFNNKHKNCDNYPNEDLVEEVGLDSSQIVDLSIINDEQGFTFSDIAEYIEEKL